MKTDIGIRIQIIALRTCKISTRQIQRITGISPRTQTDIWNRAIERGYDPSASPAPILAEYVTDAPRPGRPSTRSKPEVIESVISAVKDDRHGREKTTQQIASEVGLSAMTVWRILRAAGLKKTKPTRKPGLTLDMKLARLDFCLDHKDWTLDDWRRVIWSDETSVVLCQRRGGYRIWRTREERCVRSAIQRRWKGYSEFMFWGCFSYDRKGPCHVWKPETAVEKKLAEKKIQELNNTLEPILREEWELTTGIRRINLRRQQPGPKPVWKFTKKNGKLVRDSKKGGIDWWRYQSEVMIPKLIPFAKESEKELGFQMIIQEDKAPSHAHYYQARVYDIYQVQKLLWPGNSPDLNMIEPAWFWMKRISTKKGAPTTRTDAERAWNSTWKELPQEMIQTWIERIMRHVQKVIELEGGNEYIEGRLDPKCPPRQRGCKIASR